MPASVVISPAVGVTVMPGWATAISPSRLTTWTLGPTLAVVRRIRTGEIRGHRVQDVAVGEERRPRRSRSPSAARSRCRA